MNKKTNIPIAALCARGREIGYVLMVDGRIIRYGVKTIKGKRRGVVFLRQVARILMGVLDRLTPQYMVVVEDVSHRTKPGAVNQEIAKLKKEWMDTGSCQVRTISLKDVKYRLCDDHSVSHRALVEMVLARYPLVACLRVDFAIYRPLYWELVCLAIGMADAVEGPQDKTS